MDLRDITGPAAELIGALMPSLLGSAVAQAWKPKMPWRQRFLQWAVGSAVSYHAMLAIVALTDWGGFVAQSIGFGIGMLAWDATPPLLRAAQIALANVPSRLLDRFLPKKD
ncbi:MAG TPA: hypothetical protein VNS79_03600 [Sphingobium sp.]|nr:hypothetical protein [Sphingobium sp.]